MNHRIAIAMLIALAVVLPGCDKEFRGAVKIAQVSKRLHDAIAEPVAAEIVRLVEKHKATGALTDEERERLKLLNDARPALDGFAAVHESYVATLKVWKATGQKPLTFADLYASIVEFVAKAETLKAALNL